MKILDYNQLMSSTTIVLLGQIILLCILFSCGIHDEGDLTPVVIKNVDVITLNGDEILEDRTIIIRDSMIIEISQDWQGAEMEDTSIIDGEDRYVMPALSDMHFHLPKNNNIRALRNTMKLLLAHGITFGRNMSGFHGNHQLLKELRKEDVPYPSLILGSPFFKGNDHFQSGSQLADSARSYAKAGFHFFKVHSWLSAEEFDSLVSVAKAASIYLEGHIPKSKGLLSAISTNTYKIVDHLDGFFQELSGAINNLSVEKHGYYAEMQVSRLDFDQMPTLAEEMFRRKIGIVPTVNLVRVWYENPHDSLLGNYDQMEYVHPSYVILWNTILNTSRRLINYDVDLGHAILNARDSIVRALYAAGVPIFCGSGSYEVNIVPGFSLTDELLALHHAGLSTSEALQAATSTVADWYGLNQGRIEPGRSAELIMLDQNPLDDLNAIRNISGLFTKNRWLSRQDLDQLLQDVKNDLATSRQR